MQRLALGRIKRLRIRLRRCVGVGVGVGTQVRVWPTALQLAGLPVLQAVTFGDNGETHLPLFNGALVAMESPAGVGSRTWWPVIDAQGSAVALPEIGGLALMRARDRCRALAVALEYGVGLCGLAGEREAGAFVARVIARGRPDAAGSAQADWASAYAAARLRDPQLRFRVEWFDQVDPYTGQLRPMPARLLDDRWQLTLCLRSAGRLLRCSEPLRPGSLPQGLPTVTDWYWALWRALGQGCDLLMKKRLVR